MAVQSVLVVGATGRQGGAVADHLLDTDIEVHALTRDPDGEAAQALDQRGATLVEGDLEDRDALETAIENVDGVYGVTNFWEHGYDDEVEQGRNLAEAADAAGVDQFVFSSVGGAERDTGIAHFDSKYGIEERIRELDLPATIVRPVFFMQNFAGMRDDITGGTLALGLDHGVSLQMVDLDDIGAIVAGAFANPDDYVGEHIELAGDEHTLEGMAIRFDDVIDTDVAAEHLPVEAVEDAMGEEYAVMFEWFNQGGYEADLPRLRGAHDVDFTRLEEYVEREWT